MTWSGSRRQLMGGVGCIRGTLLLAAKLRGEVIVLAARGIALQVEQGDAMCRGARMGETIAAADRAT
eukprot:3974941-Amphidinium_carterae.1